MPVSLDSMVRVDVTSAAMQLSFKQLTWPVVPMKQLPLWCAERCER